MDGLNGTNGLNGVNGEVNGHAKLNGHSAAAPAEAPPPIAIVGIGLRLPGKITSADQFWDLLVSKKSGRCRVPRSRYNTDAFHSPSGKPGTVKTQHGYFLDCELDQMDASFFSMSRAEVERLDPQQRLLLEVVWECMESGGQRDWRGRKIGCYVGVFGEDWLDLSTKDPQHLGMYRVTGTGDFAIANRVSYEYDLKGPSMTIRTGCSSSLVGLHEACQAIYSGECESAVVAGTNLIITPTMTLALSEQGVLSPTGSCKSFDAKADGYARGEAINAVFVKKLSDALRDGDPIRGVIRATATNCDGRTQGIANPSSESHEALIRRAYQVANISKIADTGFVECHGTGTKIGDPQEASAVGRVFGGKGVLIGSVKPNVGHSEGASGLTSLIKAILALENETVPPNINFSEPNPRIAWDEFNLRVPTAPVPWPADRLARVSVNSFGIGGANAHVILDSAKPYRSAAAAAAAARMPGPRLLLFSANHADSLREGVEKIQDYAEAYPARLDGVAHTLAARREHLAYRAFAVADGTTWPVELSPVVKPKGAPRRLHMVFTGQGAQWAGMGVDLLRDFPSFQADVRAMDAALRKLRHAPLWTIEEELLRPEKTSRLHLAEFAQPICTALQIGVVNLLRACGVRPEAVVGHSSGEIAAAYAAGALTADAAMAVAYYRGQVAKQQLRRGGMAALGLGRAEAAAFLEAGVVVACENSPRSVTLSGDADRLDAVVERVKAARPGVFARRLRVEMAYHSHHMQEVGDLYESLLEGLVAAADPRVPLFSSVSAKPITAGSLLGPSYWRANLESPVLFHSAARALVKAAPADGLFIEVGPHSALAGPLREIFAEHAVDSGRAYVATLVRKEHGTRALLGALGRLHQEAVAVDLAALAGAAAVLTDLPPYSWRHDASYWSESRVARAWRQRRFAPHELLGCRVLESTDVEPAWRQVLRLDDAPWLRDHRIGDDVVLPAAAYVAMAGEAVRQLSGRPATDFALRRVDIKAALVLRDAEPAEIVTQLRPARLTDELDSEWFDFSIASFNGEVWLRHCAGQVKAGPGAGVRGGAAAAGQHARQASAERCYRAMEAAGLRYGPAFRGLAEVSARPGAAAASASASIVDRFRAPETAYALHPTTIDCCLQLLIVAAADGLPRRLATLCMPTHIGEMYVGQGDPQMRIGAEAVASPTGSIRGAATGVADGRLVLSLAGVRLTALADDEPSGGPDPVAAAQLHWLPDVHFAAPADFIVPGGHLRDAALKLERLSLLCTVEALHRVGGIPTLDHLATFRGWMAAQRDRAVGGHYDHVEDCARLAGLGRDELWAEIKAVQADVQRTPGAAVGDVLVRATEWSAAIFSGDIDAIEVLIQDGGLESIYKFMQAMCDCTRYFELLGHANPTMRILEIGAGTGGTTAEVLRGLTGDAGERMYARYDYTDISTGFFTAAQDRFKQYDGIEFRTLDVSKEPLAQGFEAESYDLILASNVLHATPSIHETLSNVRKLLKPDGRLFLQELSPVWKMFNFIMGFLSGWWLGAADGRPDEPYMPASRWDAELRASGFSGADAVVYDDERPFQINANIISTAVATTTTPTTTSNKPVTILASSPPGPAAQAVHAALRARGLAPSFATLDDDASADDVVALLDVEGPDAPFFHDLPAARLARFQAWIGGLAGAGDPTVLWITGASQAACADPRWAGAVGVARTVRAEMGVGFATLEVGVSGGGGEVDAEVVADLFERVGRERGERRGRGEVDPDWEYVLLDGVVQIPRYRAVDVRRELLVESGGGGEGPWRLGVGRVGQLQTLRWAEGERAPLADLEVEVEPRAVGLNFKDVLVAMGVVEGIKPGLGIECAGVVRAVGAGVRGLGVGDRVVAFDHACFSTSFAVRADLAAKMPEGLSFEDAASMPCVFTTAIHALINVGGLSKGQTVLIHSACGGVGIAAIQLCRMIGAEIFATVGSEEKVKYLVDTFGLPRSRIFNSRDTSFHADLMAATAGCGADLVLNSLSGELLHLSWKCVAEFGKMLEIGKRDLVGHGALGMNLFDANRTFCGIDMSRMAVQRPELYQGVLAQCMQYYENGGISPIRPIKTFPASQVMEAFREMQKGQHIGKIVVSMPEQPAELEITPTAQKLKLREDASYLLCGGLGGLGRAISNWMVENGARNLVYLSRSGGEPESTQAFIRELEAQGCSVQAFKGDVANAEDVASAVQQAAKPIAGVLHMSMVLKDRGLLDFTHDDWRTAVEPKVEGAWSIHRALGDTKLDFFVLFSSLSYVIGQIGQANYAAANAFLAAFAQYRHSLGLPASVIDIGVMEDVGYVCENPAILEQFKALSYHTLREKDLLDSLTLLISRQTSSPASSAGYFNPAELVIGLRSTKPLSDEHNRAIWKRDARMAQAHLDGAKSAAAAAERGGKADGDDLAELVARAAADASVLDGAAARERLTRGIGRRLYAFMFQPEDEVDVGMTLKALGIDSLVAIEIRNWWRQTLGFDISVLEIMGAASIAMLGKLAADGLRREFGAARGA
ncbi:Lovastatin diketide synthase LovF [Neofusicoccum parvum]|nr:Lovastatin diketide synthase LovF [Neofusicoccum parvum]